MPTTGILLAYNFLIHSNKMARRKRGHLGLDPVHMVCGSSHMTSKNLLLALATFFLANFLLNHKIAGTIVNPTKYLL